jgi:hypothetical protein
MKVIKELLTVVVTWGKLSAQAQAPADANTGRPVTDDDIAALRQDFQAALLPIINREQPCC